MPDTAYTRGFRAGAQHAAELTYAENIAYSQAPERIAAVRDDIQRHLNGLPQGRAELDAWLVGVATGGRVELDDLDTMPSVRWTDDEDHIVRGRE